MKGSVRARTMVLLKYLVLLHFIGIQIFWYYHYLSKWLFTENSLGFLGKLLP